MNSKKQSKLNLFKIIFVGIIADNKIELKFN